MVQNLLIESPVVQQLLGAMAAGSLHLVDEHARPLSLMDAADQHCWAHLRDAQDGRVYVQELTGSQELLKPQYIEMLGLNI